MEDSNRNRSEENRASQSSKALHMLKPIDLSDAGDNQESGKCHHFSIRGYVSEVRKTNREICWPFHIIDKHYKLEEHADLLPPIVVTEYRWWGCKSCLCKAHIIEVGIEDGTAMDGHNSESSRPKIDGTPFHGNPVVEAHACPPSSMSDFQIAPREKSLEEDSVEADSFIDVKDDHLQPSVCCHEKDKEFLNAGTQNPGIYLTPAEASQNLLSQTPTCGGMNCKSLRKEETYAPERGEAAAAVAFETHKNGGIISDYETTNIYGTAANIPQRALWSEQTVLQGENAHNAKTTETEEAKLGVKTSETKTELNSRILVSVTNNARACVFGAKEGQGPRKEDMFETKEVPEGLNSSFQRMDECNVEGEEGSRNKESKCNGDSVEGQDNDESFPNQLDILNVNLHRRKARKVRMLNDIIKSEVLGLSRQPDLCDGNDAARCRDDDKMDPASPKDGKSARGCNLNVVSEEKEREPSVCKKRKVSPESEDEGPSLIHWLRRVPKKVKTPKCDEEHKPASNAIVTSQSSPYALSGKCHSRIGGVQDIDSKTFEGEVPMNTTYVDAVRPHVKLKQVMNESNHAVAEGETAKCINVGKALPKLAINNRTLPPGRVQPGGSFKDSIMCRKQDATYVVEYGVTSPVNGPKDSYDTSEYETLNVYKGSQQISRKRSVRGKKGSAEEATDSAAVIHEVAAVGSIHIREKQGSVSFREKQTAIPSRKKMAASPLGGKHVDSPGSEKQGVVDGIPIEILELLQSNYHKNHQLNSGRSTAKVIEKHQLNYGDSIARMVKPSEANKNVRDGILGKGSNIAESNSDAMPCSQQNNKSGVCSKSENDGNGACAIGKHTRNSNWESRAQTSLCSGKRGRQMKVKEGQAPATLRESPDVHLCLAPPMCATQPSNTEPMGSHDSQNFNWNRVVSQNVEPHYNALTTSRQHPCKCFPCGAVQINNSHKIHTGIYNSSLLPQTTLLENNLNKVSHECSGLKLADASLSHLRRTKQKVDVKNKRTLPPGNAYVELGKVGKECYPKVTQPLDLYANDSIPAMHLLRLMDPAVGSAAPSLGPTVSNDQADFVNKFKHGENHYQKSLTGVDMGMRARYAFNCLGISENQVYNQTSSSNLMSPAPRYSALESFSQKKNLSASNNFNSLSKFKGKNPSEVAFSLKTGRKEKRKSSHLTSQSKMNEQRPLPRDKHSQDRFQSIIDYASYPKFSEAREDVAQVEYRNKGETEFPGRSSSQRLLCVVNRNPADFSIPDENNVYMISYQDLKPRYVSPNRNKQCVLHPEVPRQQRILKLLQSGR